MPQPFTAILDFWFGDDANDAVVAQKQAALWWSKNEAADAEIKQRFETTVQAAAMGSLTVWSETPLGRLVLILLTDQVPRNIYRDTPRAFAFDALARNWCKAGLEQRLDLQLRPIQRVFYYLPLEHSESRDDQQRSVQLYRELASAVSPEMKSVFDGYLDFARRHQAIIERFGRFPHRNQMLQRVSTEEELEFLQQPGSAF
ncbi:MAG: DUF924 family protein [Steroidobacteraceae bacterium]